MACLQIEVVPRPGRKLRFLRGHASGPVGLVGGLQRTGKQRILPHRLRSTPGINAAGPQVEQPGHAALPRCVNHIAGDLQVLVDELTLPGVVGQDSPYPRCLQGLGGRQGRFLMSYSYSLSGWGEVGRGG